MNNFFLEKYNKFREKVTNFAISMFCINSRVCLIYFSFHQNASFKARFFFYAKF